MQPYKVPSRMQKGGGMKPPSTIASLHYAAVKAAQIYEATTPGTRTKEAKRLAWTKAEKKFAEAIGDC